MCELVQAEEPAEEPWESGVASLLARLQHEWGGSLIRCSPFVRSCFKMLGFVPTGSEKTLVAPDTLNFKKFNSYGGRIDRVMALLYSTTSHFPLGCGGGGRQEEAAAGRALCAEGFFVSKGNNAVAAGKCMWECLPFCIRDRNELGPVICY